MANAVTFYSYGSIGSWISFLWSDIVAYTAGVSLFGIVLSHLEHRVLQKILYKKIDCIEIVMCFIVSMVYDLR